MPQFQNNIRGGGGHQRSGPLPQHGNNMRGMQGSGGINPAHLGPPQQQQFGGNKRQMNDRGLHNNNNQGPPQNNGGHQGQQQQFMMGGGKPGMMPQMQQMQGPPGGKQGFGGNRGQPPSYPTQPCTCRDRQMMMQGGNPYQQRRLQKLAGKPCFKCGGIIGAPQGGQPMQQPGRDNRGGPQQPRGDNNGGKNPGKKRMRPDELDCELDQLVQRDNVRSRGNSDLGNKGNNQFDQMNANKRSKRPQMLENGRGNFNGGGPGGYQGMGEGGPGPQMMGGFQHGGQFNKHQQRKHSFNDNASGMPPFGGGKPKRDQGNNSNKFGNHNQRGPSMNNNEFDRDLSKGRPPMGFNNKGPYPNHHRDGQHGGMSGGRFGHQGMQPGGMMKNHHQSYGGHSQQQSYHQTREQPFQEPELKLTPEQAEVLKKKRLERFGPVEPAEPTQEKSEHRKANENKIQVRCKHWPKCNKPDPACEFIHPKDECKFFPKCSYADKCLFIHPEIACKYAEQCTRVNCSYKHTRGRQQNMMMMKPWLMMAAQGMMQNPSMFINNFNANTTTPSQTKKETNQQAPSQSQQEPLSNVAAKTPAMASTADQKQTN